MQLMSKFTSAQSTLCIDNTSVVKFKKNYFVNSINDATIKNTFKVSEITRNEDKKKIIISAGASGGQGHGENLEFAVDDSGETSDFLQRYS